MLMYKCTVILGFYSCILYANQGPFFSLLGYCFIGQEHPSLL